MDGKIRCWDGPRIFIDYHDNEWGRPEHDEVKLFEMLTLESMQSGLSWITVLKKRDAFREAFDGFDPIKVAFYDEFKKQELMKNEGIIRNRMKIDAAVNNAGALLNIANEFGSFDKFIWSYVDYKPIIGEDWPSKTELSTRISKDLKKRGFKFVGPTTVYSFMQAVGITNDHMRDCFVFHELTGKKGKEEERC